MNWKLMGTIVPTLIIKLIGSSLFFVYISEIFSGVPKITSPGKTSCSLRWTLYEGNCYHFSTLQKTWDESQKECVRLNSHLAIISNKAELSPGNITSGDQKNNEMMNHWVYFKEERPVKKYAFDWPNSRELRIDIILKPTRNAFLNSKTQNADYFIGLRNSNGQWKWIDNTKFDPGLFNIQHNANYCATIGLNSTISRSCSELNRFVCEETV